MATVRFRKDKDQMFRFSNTGRLKKHVNYCVREKKLFAQKSPVNEPFGWLLENSRLTAMNCSLKNYFNEFSVVQKFYHKTINYKVNEQVFVHEIFHNFAPEDNITPEEANKMARQLVVEVYGPHVQAIFATHTDKDHIHTHILFNSVSIQGKKLYGNKTIENRLRAVSDRLCKERGLSVIENPQKGNSVKYGEWQARAKDNSWKENTRRDVDRAIMQADDFNRFKEIIKTMGYDIKENRKYLTLRNKNLGYIKFFRSDKLRKRNYTEARIKERIENREAYLVFFGRNAQSFEEFHKVKQQEYIISKSLFALQYLSFLQIIYRLIVNNLFKERKKFDVRHPYSVMNDLVFRKTLEELEFIEHKKLRSLEQYRDYKKREEIGGNERSVSSEVNKDKNKDTDGIGEIPETKNNPKPKRDIAR